MDPTNPYAAPQSSQDFTTTEWGPSAAIVDSLRQTQPWVRFFSILGFIGAGFMALGGAFLLIVGMVSSELTSSNSKFPWWLGALYWPLTAIYVPPSIFLHRYSGAIATFLSVPSMETLEPAIRHQKSFWRFMGIVTAAVIAAYILIIAGVIVFGFMTAIKKA